MMIQGVTESIEASVIGIIVIAFLTMKFLGVFNISLWGGLRFIQLIFFSALVNISFSPSLSTFYRFGVGIMQFNIFGSSFSEIFRPTLPYNDQFRYMGFNSMNMFGNSGFIFIGFLISLSLLLIFIINRMARKFFRRKIWRRLGVITEDYLVFVAPILKLL